MYQVLLVDDEDIDLESLRRLIDWQSLGLEVAAAVNSGFTALEVLRTKPIDLLVTDIKMPMMSGLELTRQALEYKPQLKTIYVSGYEDFHYAKQAIQMNANGYVLKPVDDEEIYQVLSEVKAELDLMRKERAADSIMEKSLPLVRNELLLRLLEGDVEEGGEVELLQHVGLDWVNKDLFIAVIELDDISWKLNQYRAPERSELLKKMNEYMFNWCHTYGIRYCKTEPHRIIIFPDRLARVDLLTLLIEEVSQRFPLTITIGIGPQVNNCEQIASSYTQAKEALGLKLFLGKSRIIRYSDAKGKLKRSYKDVDGILNDLFTAMMHYELVRITDHLQELFELVKNMDSRLSIYHFSLHVISKLDTHMNLLNENMYSLLGLERKELDILYHFETIEDIHSWLRRRIFELSELLQLKKQRKHRKLLEEVERYLISNVDHPITLRDAANHFSFSPNHFGHLFKEGSGMNFSDYVIRVRMNRAIELLKDPKVRIYEVAGQVGYKNLAYFTRQFREVFGMTPGDYRRQS